MSIDKADYSKRFSPIIKLNRFLKPLLFIDFLIEGLFLYKFI